MLLDFSESDPNGGVRSGRARRRLLIGSAIAAIVLGNVITFAVLWRNRYPRRFAPVEAGVLYRSAQPTGAQIQRLVDNFGIRTVIIARDGNSPRIKDERAAAAKNGVKVVHIPIESRAEIRPECIAEFWRVVSAPENQPVLVHCAAGRHRTGFLCAMYRIERQGWEPARAREEMLGFGFDDNDQSAVLKQFDRYAASLAAREAATRPN